MLVPPSIEELVDFFQSSASCGCIPNLLRQVSGVPLVHGLCRIWPVKLVRHREISS